jgi:hypothetical protein
MQIIVEFFLRTALILLLIRIEKERNCMVQYSVNRVHGLNFGRNLLYN